MNNFFTPAPGLGAFEPENGATSTFLRASVDSCAVQGVRRGENQTCFRNRSVAWSGEIMQHINGPIPLGWRQFEYVPDTSNSSLRSGAIKISGRVNRQGILRKTTTTAIVGKVVVRSLRPGSIPILLKLKKGAGAENTTGTGGAKEIPPVGEDQTRRGTRSISVVESVEDGFVPCPVTIRGELKHGAGE